MKNRRSEDGKISREVWKAVEAKVGKIRVEKKKKEERKEEEKEKEEKIKERKNNGD